MAGRAPCECRGPRVQEFGPAATETLVAVAALLMLAVSPASINGGDDVGPAADAPPSSAATATTAPAEADTHAVERIAVPAPAPGPDDVGPVGVADRAEEDHPCEEIIVVPAGGDRGVRFYDGDYSERPRPDVYLEDSTGRQVRLWVFDEATVARPQDAPYIEAVTSDVTPAAP